MKDIPSFLTIPLAMSSTSDSPKGNRFFAESYAQVATSVIQPVLRKSCGLKPGKMGSKKSDICSVRFQPGELTMIRTKAQLAGVSTNTYVRASALGSDYKPPIHPELQKLLLSTNRELTAQGNNLNQIARLMHTGKFTPDQSIAMLDSIRVPLIRALLAIKNALAPSEPQS